MIIELAGLSGAGKTTACQIIARTHATSKFILTAQWYRWLKKFKMDKIFLILTTVYFRKIVRIFYLYSQRIHHKTFFQWIIHVFKICFRARADRYQNQAEPVADILLLLNRIIVIYSIGSLETFFRGKPLLIDDGFIQRSASIWLRTPQELQSGVLSVYRDCLPSKIRCILMDCDPAEALQRSRIRGDERAVFKSFSQNFEKKDLFDSYNDMAAVLNSLQTARRFRNISRISVANSDSPQVQAELVWKVAQQLSGNNDLLCWACC